MPRASPNARPLPTQEAVKGTKRKVGLGGLRGAANTAVDIDIPAGVDTGDQIQIETSLGPRQPRVRLAVPIEVGVFVSCVCR